jgi:hypothetical protein
MISRKIDERGRILLDQSLAGSTMLVERREGGTIILRPAVTVPSNEAWLWKNKKALAMVQSGIDEASRREFVAAPNLVLRKRSQ